MGFYIRKSISLGGGVRLNLSGRGLGVSAGVKGFRVGMNGRGTYVHMGRGGLYYRKQFSYSAPSRQPSSLVPPAAASAAPDVVFTENLDQPLAITSAPTYTQHIADHFKKRSYPYWITVVLGVLAFFSVANLVVALVLAAMAGISFYLIERVKAKDVLVYDLEDDALERFSDFVEAFEDFFSSHRLWQYTARSFTHDLKRNAGVNWLMNRKVATSTTNTEKIYRTNISAPCLRMGDEQQLIFLPDLVVLTDGKNTAAFRYTDVRVAQEQVRFVEHEALANDAKVVGHAWRYQNKNGGPDLRFKNNAQIPICQYEEIGFGIGDGVGRVFVKSSMKDYARFYRALTDIAESTARLKEVDTSRMLPA